MAPGRLEVRTGSLSTAELCPGLGCSEPDWSQRGQSLWPLSAMWQSGATRRRRSYISTLGSPGVIEEGSFLAPHLNIGHLLSTWVFNFEENEL